LEELTATLKNFRNMEAKPTEVEKFYAWMEKMKNAYLHDNARMDRAFKIVADHG